MATKKTTITKVVEPVSKPVLVQNIAILNNPISEIKKINPNCPSCKNIMTTVKVDQYKCALCGHGLTIF